MGDDIFILLALVVVVLLAAPICIVVLLVGQSRLKERVSHLERGFAAAKSGVMLRLAEPAPVAVAAAIVKPDTVFMPDNGPEPVAVVERMAAADEAIPRASVDQNRPIVMRADQGSALIKWLTVNWVYVVSALSLAMAGVFFVQYGMEHGILPPVARVAMAILFGAGLIAAGEWVRRRGGDGADETTAYLPSVFSGAGLVSIFAGIIAARQLYGLIGPEVAFAGLCATAVLAVVLGWFYGPLLAAVGLLGAAAAPFLVSGGEAPGVWLYGYYAVIAAAGLAVDAVRRWAWVSVLALVLGYGGGYLMLIGGAGLPGWVVLLVALALVAAALPVFRVIPDHPGPTVLEALLQRGKAGWPPFPVRLAAGAGLASALGLLVQVGGSSSEGMLIYAALAALALLYLLWADRALGLSDLALLPAAAFLARLSLEALGYWPVVADFWSEALAFRPPETPSPYTVTLLLGMATLMTGASALRAMAAGPFRPAFGLGAVLVAPAAAAILELLWAPGQVVGVYPWALQIIALAALMVLLALQFAKVDGADRRRVAHATLSALSLIALALFLITTKSALTMALAVLVVVAAWLDRRYRLPEMGIFIQIGAAVLSYRLLVDPGIGWAMDAGLGSVILTFGSVIAGLLAAIWLLIPLERKLPIGVLESAVAGYMAVFANVLISRLLLPQDNPMDGHYAVTLNALPWLVMMLVQLYRSGFGGGLRKLRLGIAAVAGLIAGAGLLVAAGPASPLFSYGPGYPEGLVYGPMVLDSLLLAYAVPGLMLLAAAWRFRMLDQRLRLGFAGVGVVLLSLYVGLEIRRFWQGDWLGANGVLQGELYSYTVAMMLVGAGLFYQAIARRSSSLRRIAMAVVGLTVAKVFLLDASGLTGLTRVVSLLGLGLSLAALAWLNRWAGQAAHEEPPKG